MAQKLHVVEVNAGDDGAIGVDDVDGVQPPAQAHFQNHHVQRRARDDVQNGQGGKLKVGQRHRVPLGARSLHCGKPGNQGFGLHHLALQTQAFFKMHQVGGRIHRSAVACLQQDGFQHGAGRALAVGARHGDYRAMQRQPHARGNHAHAL